MFVYGYKTVLFLAQGIVSGFTELEETASNMELRIEGKNGQLLERIPLGNHEKGAMTLRWDGLNLMQDGKIIDIDRSKLNRQEFYKDEDGEFVKDGNGNK